MASTVSSAGAPGRPAERTDLDRAVGELEEAARAFVRLAPEKKATLLRACLARVIPLADEWVKVAAREKKLGSEEAVEEWAEPWILMRALRLYAESLEAIAEVGKPPFGRSVSVRSDGRVVALAMPCSGYDKVAYLGYEGHVFFQAGLDVQRARALQAARYLEPAGEGRVALVLGAGNRSVIPALDVLHKLVFDSETCLLKMNPVNEWAGPILERILEPLAAAGFLRFVYGGSDVGEQLSDHPGIATLHMTGSHLTHDRIVWGAPGPEQDRRRAEGTPLNARPVTSELGSVSAVAVVPAEYTERELDAQLRILVTSVVNNASFNCNATKLLVLDRRWRQRELFLERLAAMLERIPPRHAYYPGARDRYLGLTQGRAVRALGGPVPAGYLPWTLITDVDPDRPDEPLFRTEPFCAILSETSLATAGADDFLTSATAFLNERVWGTLSVAIVCPPKVERDPTLAAALDRAIRELEYGTVALNTWPAVGFGLPSLPWGGHPSSTPADIQSGSGFVHNTYLFGGVEKVVVRCPIVPRPLPPWLHGRPGAERSIRAFLRYEAEPSPKTTLGVGVAAL